jgi:hypothetical protein
VTSELLPLDFDLDSIIPAIEIVLGIPGRPSDWPAVVFRLRSGLVLVAIEMMVNIAKHIENQHANATSCRLNEFLWYHGDTIDLSAVSRQHAS